MTLPDPLLAFWYAASELAATTRRTPWGVVASDRRFPLIWDANHAAVLENHDRVSAEEIREELLPALREAGAGYEHVEFWDPAEPCPAVRDVLAAGGRHARDVLMVAEEAPTVEVPSDVMVTELAEPEGAVAAAYAATRRMFGGDLSDEVIEQMERREREVLRPVGLRLFAAFLDGAVAGFVGLLSLEGVGYLDGVVTLPDFRRRGVAAACVLRAVRESRDAGHAPVHLLAEVGGRPQALYERLGFRARANVVSATRPLTGRDA